MPAISAVTTALISKLADSPVPFSVLMRPNSVALLAWYSMPSILKGLPLGVLIISKSTEALPVKLETSLPDVIVTVPSISALPRSTSRSSLTSEYIKEASAFTSPLNEALSAMP